MYFSPAAFIAGLVPLLIVLVIVAVLLANAIFIVRQQTEVIIERLGKFNRIVGPGIHLRIPVIAVREHQVETALVRLKKPAPPPAGAAQ